MRRLLILMIYLLGYAARAGDADQVRKPDVVIRWNNVAVAVIEAEPMLANPTFGSRALAMVHAAIFDAVNTIIPKRQPYALRDYSPPPEASVQAAAAQAAYLVLVGLAPDQQELLAEELARDLDQVCDPKAERRGVQVGTAAAQAILRLRANDGADCEVDYQPGTCPGQWRPTPPDYTPARWPQWPYVRPFVVRYGAQFRPGPPPPLNSAAFACAFNEVKLLGELDSRVRSREQTEIGYYWSYDLPPNEPPPSLYNEILEVIALKQGNSLAENAYLFAIENLAMADGMIATWDAKYFYNFWRPVTGIRLANQDNNPWTKPDPDWGPLGPPELPTWTPSFPSYTSGHAAFGGVLFRTLQLYYRTDNLRFTYESSDLPGRPRSYARLSQADQENADSRIYLGVHWRFDQTMGQELGHQVAEYVFTHALLPRR